jgi:hypothetical protein
LSNFNETELSLAVRSSTLTIEYCDVIVARGILIGSNTLVNNVFLLIDINTLVNNALVLIVSVIYMIKVGNVHFTVA